MTLTEIKDQMNALIEATFRKGLSQGLSEGASRFEFWAAVEPASISKKDLIEALNVESKVLYTRAKEAQQ